MSSDKLTLDDDSDWMQSAKSHDEINSHVILNGRLFFPSTFGFLMAHNGLRPGCSHGILGTLGSGKSTLLKALICQTAEAKRVGVYLSEERVLSYQVGINRVNSNQEILDNIKFIQESNLKKDRTPRQIKGLIEMAIKEMGLKAIFMDNITTSCLYGDHVNQAEQCHTIEWMNETARATGCSFFYVAHTKKEVTDNLNRLLTPEDVRGNTLLPIMTEYFYTLQKFEGNERQYHVVRNCKHRYHEKASGFFLLKYENGRYVEDSKINFERVNEIFKMRDSFGKAR